MAKQIKEKILYRKIAEVLEEATRDLDPVSLFNFLNDVELLINDIREC